MGAVPLSPVRGAIQAPALSIRAAVLSPAPTALPLPPRWAQGPLRPYSPAGRERPLLCSPKLLAGLCLSAPLSELSLPRLRRREQPPPPGGAASRAATHLWCPFALHRGVAAAHFSWNSALCN